MPHLLYSSPLPLPSLCLRSHLPSPFNSRKSLFFDGALTARRLSSCRRYLRAIPIYDQELLQVLTESSGVNGEARTHLPAVRSYETDLARLTLIGSVAFDQALIAAAADGGDVAEEHLAAGTSTMVVETVFPGGSDDHSTVSTRLFLPAKMVKEKARKLKNSPSANLLYGKDTLSKNILAMTFRQVVLQSLWSFQLSLFCPGTVRNMEDLESTREVLADFILSSSDEKFISSIAEVVSSCALESTKNKYIREAGRLPPNNTQHCFQKPGNTSSIGSSISICRVSESDIAKDARNQVETYKLVRGKSVNRVKKQKYDWWLPPDLSKLDMIGGPGFGSWTSEFIPMYRLQIDFSTFKDVKFEGWHRLVDNRWEVLLTHYQMVELANILDMYFEDRYTIPNKMLSFDLVTETHTTLKSKNTSWKLLFSVLTSVCAVIIFGILARIFWLKHATKASELKDIHTLSEVNFFHLDSLESTKMEALCISIIKMVKDDLGWPEDVMINKNIGVWIGALPSFLRNRGFTVDAISSEVLPNSFDANSASHAVVSPSEGASLAASDLQFQKIGHDIASYQVVMTTDGKLIGFQPTSTVAVNHWSSNPLAKSLYGVQKLSPGFFEPRLNIPRPPDAIPIELLMSMNPESRFALARPMQ